MEVNKIYNIECVEGMRNLPDDCVDLVVTSPPYDNLRNYKQFDWDFEATAKQLYRITKQGGVVVWIVNDKINKGSESGTRLKQAIYFKEVGFNLNSTMIWVKSNPMPQHTNSPRYTDAFEFMFVFSKGKPKTFNPLQDKCKTAGQKNNRNINSSAFLDRGNFKGVWKRDEVTTTKKTKRKTNVWSFATATKNYGHPAVFPEQLVQDHILSWSNEGDIVLDPFMGSGTTAKMALLNNRKYIGFEISKEYCEIAEKRVAEANNQKGVLLLCEAKEK